MQNEMEKRGYKFDETTDGIEIHNPYGLLSAVIFIEPVPDKNLARESL